MARYRDLHPWNVSPARAIELQNQLRGALRLQAPGRPIETIAGADISFDKFSPVVYAGVVVLRLSTLEVLEEVGVVSEAPFPYVPGLLTFREAPAVLEAWSKLEHEPDAVMIDGHGAAHPRRMGIASHLGLALDRPTLGCGKSILVGRFAEPEEARGSWTPLIHKGEIIGAALRTKNRVQPVFISPGDRMDLPTAIDLALRCDGGYRIPEPTRRAHLLVNALRRGERKPSAQLTLPGLAPA